MGSQWHHTMDQDEFDNYLKLASYYMDIRKDRRQHEWKVSLGLWAGLAAGIVAAKDFPTIPWWLLALLLALVVIGYVGLWVWSNESRNERDGEKAYKHSDKAEVLLNPSFVPDCRKCSCMPYGTTLFECLATALLALTLFATYCASHPRANCPCIFAALSLLK
jgi:hypothetical protein